MTGAASIRLRDGNSIPQLGLGVYGVPAQDTAALVLAALGVGYRHVDTAKSYGNESQVGSAVRDCGLPRVEVFVTSKVWHDDHGYDETLRAFEASVDRLGLDYLDMYLIHWPVPAVDRYVDTWRALVRLRDEGLVRVIGVSNFHPHHIQRIVEDTGVTPSVNQVEMHPWLPQRALRSYCAEQGIQPAAWAPLSRGRVAREPVLDRLADKYGRTPAQVVIRWHLQLGNVVIPKTARPDRLRENFDVFDFTLDPEDLDVVTALETGERTSRDPDSAELPRMSPPRR